MSMDNEDKRTFYIAETEKNNRTARQLERQVASQLFERLLLSSDVASVLAVARQEKLPSEASEIIKDPMVLKFLGLRRKEEVKKQKKIKSAGYLIRYKHIKKPDNWCPAHNKQSKKIKAVAQQCLSFLPWQLW